MATWAIEQGPVSGARACSGGEGQRGQSWRRVEVERTGQRVRGGVPFGEGRQTVDVLDQPQDRGEVVLGVVDEPALRPRRDEQGWGPGAEPVHVRMRRGDVIVEPAEVVP